MKIVNISTRWIFILCLPVLLFTIGISSAVNFKWLYTYGFDKYDVSQATGLSQSELEKAAGGLIDYFNSAYSDINLTVKKDGETFELFNQREIIHLRDVKDLFHMNYWILLGTLLHVLGYTAVMLIRRRENYRERLAQSFIYGSSITLGLLLVLGLGILLNFDNLFWQFHVFSFSNDFWQLNPARDYLIMLFPGGFWYDAALFCTSVTIILSIITGGVAGGYMFFRKRVLAS
ncbi:TIGR01906 family membrane protein [Chloroflexota bacterium]